jgi:pimeloyl-ACP methyl ester carboxylesterase
VAQVRARQTILITAALGGAAVVGLALTSRYRRDLRRACARLGAVNRRVISTALGNIEYAERGSGEPLLVVHGIFHGCDGGLLSASDLPHDRRLIAPSRFGYLGSPLPPDATPARQADAFAALLDELGVKSTDVVGISAGTTSALQFALRHPHRVKHLVVISGNLPGNPTAVAPPAWARVFYADVPLWAMKVFAPRAYLHLMGVPKDLPLGGDAAAFVDEMAESIFPMAPRTAGGMFDAFVSNPDVNDYPLESITVPTLLVHAQDDPLTSCDAAERATKRIPRARLVVVPTGGHLMIGQADLVGPAISAFLAEPLPTPEPEADYGQDGNDVLTAAGALKSSGRSAHAWSGEVTP